MWLKYETLSMRIISFIICHIRVFFFTLYIIYNKNCKFCTIIIIVTNKRYVCYIFNAYSYYSYNYRDNENDNKWTLLENVK